MKQRTIGCIAPCFIVRDVPAALAFYRDRLGFTITFQGPAPDDIFFGIVERDAAMIMMKAVGVEPTPNHTRDIKQGLMRWDAYLYVPDPDALAIEFESLHVEFMAPLADNDDNLRGFEVQDLNGYILYFGRPNTVQGQVGGVVADHTAGPHRCVGGRRRHGEAGLRRDDAHAEDRHRDY